jgi:hypothetical protein
MSTARPKRDVLLEDKVNVICGLFSARAMIPNDLNQPIEHGCADTGTRVQQPPA